MLEVVAIIPARRTFIYLYTNAFLPDKRITQCKQHKNFAWDINLGDDEHFLNWHKSKPLFRDIFSWQGQKLQIQSVVPFP